MIVGPPGIFKLLAKSSRVILKNCGGALDKACEDARNEGYNIWIQMKNLAEERASTGASQLGDIKDREVFNKLNHFYMTWGTETQVAPTLSLAPSGRDGGS